MTGTADRGAFGSNPPAAMIADHSNGLLMYRFPGLTASGGLLHGVFTRKGGASKGPFAELNVGMGAGDNPEHVRENRRRIGRALGVETAVFLRQRHGSRVVVDCDGAQGRPGPEEADAVITDRTGRLLVIQVADCQAVILHDPVRKVVANIHSGWRGSVADILGKTVTRMQSQFGCRTEDLRAGIGPSLGPCCAEFIHYRKEIPSALWQYRVGDCHFDFWTMSVDQLKAAGVAKRHIEVAGLCTRCRTDLFFSYRGERTTGRFAVAAGLIPEKAQGR
ncbi:MAG: peptidoglycan editing factor PgeF [Desulfobacterales bacterium]